MEIFYKSQASLRYEFLIFIDIENFQNSVKTEREGKIVIDPVN